MTDPMAVVLLDIDRVDTPRDRAETTTRIISVVDEENCRAPWCYYYCHQMSSVDGLGVGAAAAGGGMRAAAAHAATIAVAAKDDAYGDEEELVAVQIDIVDAAVAREQLSVADGSVGLEAAAPAEEDTGSAVFPAAGDDDVAETDTPGGGTTELVDDDEKVEEEEEELLWPRLLGYSDNHMLHDSLLS